MEEALKAIREIKDEMEIAEFGGADRNELVMCISDWKKRLEELI